MISDDLRRFFKKKLGPKYKGLKLVATQRSDIDFGLTILPSSFSGFIVEYEKRISFALSLPYYEGTFNESPYQPEHKTIIQIIMRRMMEFNKKGWGNFKGIRGQQ